MAINKVEVTINSRQYKVLANESEEYIRRLAGHIDEKVKIVLKNGQNVMGERPIVLAALNICDEYYKSVQLTEELQSELAKVKEERRLIEENAPQISFDEAEAEELLHKAEQTIEILRGRVKELENKLNGYGK